MQGYRLNSEFLDEAKELAQRIQETSDVLSTQFDINYLEKLELQNENKNLTLQRAILILLLGISLIAHFLRK